MARPTIKFCEIHNIPRYLRERNRGGKLYNEHICKKCTKERSDAYFSIQRHHYLKRYGINLEKYEIMLKEQNNKCAICDRHKDLFKKSFAVDHCHITGKIRGLLCFHCNTGIGKLGDNIESITKALNYLKKGIS